MSSLLLALLAAAVGGLAAWRIAMARRRAAATRAAREQATQATLQAARRRLPPAPAARHDTPDAARSARAASRAKAERVIAAEMARREAGFQTARSAHAATDRRATEAAARVPKTAAETLIMTVDDSKMVRVKSSRLLAAHGFQVVTAVDGLDALRQLENCSPDLVITDVEMPGMDGFGLVNALRGDPRTRHIPLVMITSAEERHRDDAQRAGVGLMMGKPYDEAALIAHIRGFRFIAEADHAPAPA